jgi:hypothetical protein
MGRRRASPDGWPGFDAPLLREAAEAFARRRKALGYQADPSCRREFVEGWNGTRERLDLARTDLLGRCIKLSACADGGLWVAVRVRGKGRNSGWSFADGFHSSALDVAPSTLVVMVASTVAMSFGSDRPPSASDFAYSGRGSCPGRRAGAPVPSGEAVTG